MPQARGTQSRFVLYDETTYGEDPGAPDGQLLRVKSYGVVSSQPKQDSETIPDAGDNRARSEALPGNIDVAGSIVVELGGLQEDKLFKHLCGGVIIGRPVTPPAAPNVTGVEYVRAEDTCPTGVGTLTFAIAGTTLAWAANGDTAGTAVDVSAGGEFTLESNTAGGSITVNVTAGSLPAGNASDADVTVVAAYQKEYTPGDLPVGMAHDKDYGSNISGTGRVEHFNGIRIGRASIKLPQVGPVEATFECMGANSALASAILDATPTDNGHNPFSGFHIVAEEGGAGIGILKEASVEIANELDEDGYTIPAPGGVAGIRGSLAEGFASCSGNINALFESAALINKAIGDTESSLKFTISRGDGYGTAGNEAVIVRINQLKYERATPPIEGPGGVNVNLNFKAHLGSDGTAPYTIIVRNQVNTF